LVSGEGRDSKEFGEVFVPGSGKTKRDRELASFFFVIAEMEIVR
jgi:hypothetical protein